MIRNGQKTKDNIDRIKKRVFTKTFVVYLVLLLIILTLFYIDLKNIYAFDNSIVNVITFIMYVLITLVITKLFVRFTVNKVFRFFEDSMEVEERIFISKLYSIFIYALAISVILYMGGFTLTNITIFLGFIATGLAFAVRDIIMSFFVWIIILSKKPFRIGDVITFADDTGVVDRIGTFFTTIKLKQAGNEYKIKIPNKGLLDKNLKNHGKNKIVETIKFKFKKVPKNTEKFLTEFKLYIDKLELKNYEIIFDHNDGKLYLVLKFLDDFYNIDNTKNKIILNVYLKYGNNFTE